MPGWDTSLIQPLEASLGQRAFAEVGHKAGTLATLAAAGLPVPDGLVVTTECFRRWLKARQAVAPHAGLPSEVVEALRTALAARLGNVLLAVRSSGVSEDLPQASFAGQYETVLDVYGAEAVEAAVLRCWTSGLEGPVLTYRAQRTGLGSGNSEMAVLVQRLVQPSAAGVAFTANPISGERSELIISAIHGRAERLVSGEVAAEEWVVRGDEATCRASPEPAIDAARARAVADLARRAEAELGCPADIEWAIDGTGQLWLLQARPITALEAAPVRWDPPGPGGWSRTFRFGEWLGDAASPLFASWLLPRLDDRFWAQLDDRIGLPFRPTPSYALVNGWYFASMNFWNVNPLRVVARLATTRKSWRLIAAIDPQRFPRSLGYWLAGWDEALPAHRTRVAQAEASVDALRPTELLGLVDDPRDGGR